MAVSYLLHDLATMAATEAHLNSCVFFLSYSHRVEFKKCFLVSSWVLGRTFTFFRYSCCHLMQTNISVGRKSFSGKLVEWSSASSTVYIMVTYVWSVTAISVCFKCFYTLPQKPACIVLNLSSTDIAKNHKYC